MSVCRHELGVQSPPAIPPCITLTITEQCGNCRRGKLYKGTGDVRRGNWGMFEGGGDCPEGNCPSTVAPVPSPNTCSSASVGASRQLLIGPLFCANWAIFSSAECACESLCCRQRSHALGCPSVVVSCQLSHPQYLPGRPTAVPLPLGLCDLAGREILCDVLITTQLHDIQGGPTKVRPTLLVTFECVGKY